jgi:hypothetical protein
MIFVGKTWRIVRVVPCKGLHWGRILVLHSNIRLGWNCLTVTNTLAHIERTKTSKDPWFVPQLVHILNKGKNTLAYYDGGLITTTKSCIVPAIGVKLFDIYVRQHATTFFFLFEFDYLVSSKDSSLL